MSEEHEEKSLLDRYALAVHDVEMLQVFLQNLLHEPGPAGLTLQQVIQRSLVRAEAEVAELKVQYEQRGER